jgi:hypothetical protein
MKNQKVSTQVARRIHIGTSVVDGRSLAETARELGISREWASKIANAPETQQIIASPAQGSVAIWEIDADWFREGVDCSTGLCGLYQQCMNELYRPLKHDII